MVQALEGWWGLPKGHAEGSETPRDAAMRELTEETSLHVVRILHSDPLMEKYKYVRSGIMVDKSVYYFVAEVEGALKVQPEEIKDAAWIPCSQASAKATYPELKALLKAIPWEIYVDG